jgi:hypothetical protein
MKETENKTPTINFHFNGIPLSEKGVDEVNEIREAFSVLWATLDKLCHSSREKNLALTKLQEASHWAVRCRCIGEIPPQYRPIT